MNRIDQIRHKHNVELDRELTEHKNKVLKSAKQPKRVTNKQMLKMLADGTKVLAHPNDKFTGSLYLKSPSNSIGRKLSNFGIYDGHVPDNVAKAFLKHTEQINKAKDTVRIEATRVQDMVMLGDEKEARRLLAKFERFGQ